MASDYDSEDTPNRIRIMDNDENPTKMIRVVTISIPCHVFHNFIYNNLRLLAVLSKFLFRAAGGYSFGYWS